MTGHEEHDETSAGSADAPEGATPSERKPPPDLPMLKPPPRSMTRSRDLLQYYLAEVRRYPLLTPEQEKDLAVRYQDTGDREAAERLVTANLRLVIKIAFQYHRQWANVLDLIQEGNVGLVEALSRYDPYREIRFSSYAQYWIRAMILRFLLDNYRLVKLGSSRAGRKLFFQLQKERNRLLKQGIDPTPKLIAERLGVKESEVNAVDRHMRAPALSLHGPAGGDDTDGRMLAEVVPETDPNDPEDNASKSQLGKLMKERFEIFESTLDDERELDIWKNRMIVTDQESLASIGERWGVSKERIRQVQERIKSRLKAYLVEEFGDEIAFEFDIPED